MLLLLMFLFCGGRGGCSSCGRGCGENHLDHHGFMKRYEVKCDVCNAQECMRCPPMHTGKDNDAAGEEPQEPREELVLLWWATFFG
jgi:hypothetical protein